MSTPRALANQKLYHARILANSWRTELAAQVVPATVLAGAFQAPAVAHLRQAYGWFLVEIAQPAETPRIPPDAVDALPGIEPGRAAPGELHELRQLEQNGWLRDLLRAGEEPAQPTKSVDSLAIGVPQGISPDQIDDWIERLQQIFERMADSLDEY